VIALIGFLDDRGGGVSVLFRFLVQLAVAGLIVWRYGAIQQLPLPAPLDIELGFLAFPISLFWIVGFVNLYNFLDGIDGFAGLQGVIAGLVIGLWGHNELTGIGLAIAGACAGFLPHNWRPARIFMGDIGSGTLGFLIAALPFQVVTASRSDALFIVAMGLWFFASDGVFTVLRRLSRGERIWIAHRSHLYQRLVRTGLRHDYVTVRVMVAAAALSALAVVAVRRQGDGLKWSVVGLACIGFLAYYFWTLVREKQLGEGVSAQLS
jgi:UDP-N-acetylmuramyl pentapeptide phosphotransferase/UDP-N-acetylglucosamine-1-phosphate transferase